MNLIIVGHIAVKETPTDRAIVRSHPLPSGLPTPKGIYTFLYGSKRILPSLRRAHMDAREKGLEFFRVDMTVPCESRTAKMGIDELNEVEFLFTDLIKVDLRNALTEMFADDTIETTSLEISDILNGDPSRILRLWEDPRFAHIKLFATKIAFKDSDSRQQYEQIAFLRSLDDISECSIRGAAADVEVVFEQETGAIPFL